MGNTLDPEYVPDDFSWAGQTMRRAKDIHWAPMASKEDIERAEAAYRQRELLQREQIKKLQEEERKVRKKEKAMISAMSRPIKERWKKI